MGIGKRIIKLLERIDGLTELEICDLLGISHGSFFAAMRELIDGGEVEFFRQNRKKIYSLVRKNCGNTVTENTKCNAENGSVIESDADAKRGLGDMTIDPPTVIESDYDENGEGFFPAIDEFISIIEDIKPGYTVLDHDHINRYVIVDDQNGNLMRYDYKLIQGGIEVRRFSFSMTWEVAKS